MSNEVLSTHQKAFQVNMDPAKYGAFAEIGAGQEVARWFFKVGGAAGTIAKTMSAYDMTVSDAIYGKADRYVSRERLHKMLEHEYALMVERLDAKRGDQTKFFVFADTVAARSFKGTGECHGWMGVRFQTTPRSEPSNIIIHVRMLDRDNLAQQEAIGIIGVNLIHGALYHHDDPSRLLLSLLDGLSTERIEVDMVKFSGPDFAGVDNRLMILELVEHGLASSAMFTANGEVVQASELLYKKPILVERGSFRPVTHVTLDMLRCAQAQFVQDPNVAGTDVLVLFEMTLRNLADPSGAIDHRDFLDRVDLLCSMGKTVLISSYARYFRLAEYLFRYTKCPVGLVMGVPSLKEIFEEKYYTDLDGGILESFGRMFKNNLRLYVYPLQDTKTKAVITAGNFMTEPHLRHLYAYLVENHFIQSIRDFDERHLCIFSRDVLAKLRSNDGSWENAVPPEVARLIKERQLFCHG